MSEIPPPPEPAPRLFAQETDEETKKEQDQSVILNALVNKAFFNQKIKK